MKPELDAVVFDSLDVGMLKVIAAIYALEDRIAALETAAKPNLELVPRGKYAGRQRSWVVAHDPHHVAWLFENKHSASMGYTEEHLQEARKLIAGAAGSRE